MSMPLTMEIKKKKMMKSVILINQPWEAFHCSLLLGIQYMVEKYAMNN